MRVSVPGTVYPVRVKEVRQRQKNGDIYVLRRQIQYDPVKGYDRVLKTGLTDILSSLGRDAPFTQAPDEAVLGDGDLKARILTVAWYYFSTHSSLPRIEHWQLTHNALRA